MKKIFVISVAWVAFMACNNDTKTEKADAKKDAGTSTGITQNPDYQKGLDIIAKNDCLTCHKVDEAVTGPPYREVANKYAGVDTAESYLAHKIMNGGSGVWGQIPMVPHHNLTEDEARTLARYILLLKK